MNLENWCLLFLSLNLWLALPWVSWAFLPKVRLEVLDLNEGAVIHGVYGDFTCQKPIKGVDELKLQNDLDPIKTPLKTSSKTSLGLQLHWVKGRCKLGLELDFDEYLARVLSCEVPASWPYEALKAQAIVSRTYALKKILNQKYSKAKDPFHLKTSVLDQVVNLGGLRIDPKVLKLQTKVQRRSIDPIFYQVVQETSGELVVHSKSQELMDTYFHAYCAGHTLLPEQVWGGDASLTLKAVACHKCASQKPWKLKISMEELKEKFKSLIPFEWNHLTVMPDTKVHYMYPIEGQGNLNFGLNQKQSLPPAGTVRFIAKAKKNVFFEISAEKFRSTLGYNRLKSTRWMDFEVLPDTIIITGKGFGHGVGFCQKGAQALALNQKKAHDLVRHYFPQAKVVSWDSLRDSQRDSLSLELKSFR